MEGSGKVKDSAASSDPVVTETTGVMSRPGTGYMGVAVAVGVAVWVWVADIGTSSVEISSDL